MPPVAVEPLRPSVDQGPTTVGRRRLRLPGRAALLLFALLGALQRHHRPHLPYLRTGKVLDRAAVLLAKLGQLGLARKAELIENGDRCRSKTALRAARVGDRDSETPLGNGKAEEAFSAELRHDAPARERHQVRVEVALPGDHLRV